MAIEVKYISENEAEENGVLSSGIYIVIDGVALLCNFASEQDAWQWVSGIDWTKQTATQPPESEAKKMGR